MQMKTDLNICMQWIDTIVKPSEASLMSQDFYESSESTMQTGKLRAAAADPETTFQTKKVRVIKMASEVPKQTDAVVKVP